MTRITYVTSESVTEGHPDKIADQIADAILDELFKQDPYSRVAIECLTTTGTVHVAGEVTTKGYVDVQKIVRTTLKEIGYVDPKFGIDCDDAGVWSAIHEQSPDISQGVTESSNKEQGAGDQGMMYGFACNETKEFMPLPIVLAHKLTRRLSEVRKKNIVPNLGPDGKSQVSIMYDDGKPKKLTAVVIAQQHKEEISEQELKKQILEQVIKPVCKDYMDKDTKIHINATGAFVIGGPEGDTGVTGRKIIVDTYGGIGRHGGGAFCVSGNSVINFEHGLARISDMHSVKKGALIKTDISPTPFEKWLDNGVMETLEIETSDGYKLEGTANQNIRVIDKNGNYIWRRFDSVQPADYIAIQRKNRLFGQKSDIDFKFSHKKGTFRKNTFEFPKELTEDYAYLLGLLIGDGRCTSKDGVQLCVCEKQMKEAVQDLFKRLFGKKGKIFGHWAHYCGVELRAYLAQLGLDYSRSWQKSVPASVFKAPKNVVAAFIRGLFDTDGTIRPTGRNNNSLDIKLTTTSEKLATDVQQLLLNFGIITHIQKVNSSGKISYIGNRPVQSRRTLYNIRLKGSVSIDIFQKNIGFGLPRKAKILNTFSNSYKRNLLIVPNQRVRVKRLWAKLSSREHQKDITNVGRWLRDPSTKGTKELTYTKLSEFLDAYEKKFAGDLDFEYLRTYYIMGHYYTRIKNIKKGQSHVYDFTVPGVHAFTANGFVCHNSGKDPTKVDRSGAYAARHVAKNIVAAGLADRCEVQLSYCIGVAEPTSINVDCFGTNKIPEQKIVELVKKHFPLTPKGIIDALKLRRPIYRKTAAYGHFGRDDPDFTWEKTDKADLLRKEAGL